MYKKEQKIRRAPDNITSQTAHDRASSALRTPIADSARQIRPRPGARAAAGPAPIGSRASPPPHRQTPMLHANSRSRSMSSAYLTALPTLPNRHRRRHQLSTAVPAIAPSAPPPKPRLTQPNRRNLVHLHWQLPPLDGLVVVVVVVRIYLLAAQHDGSEISSRSAHFASRGLPEKGVQR